MIKAIIFDWGRTLHDPDADTLMTGAKEILEYLREKGYRMSLLSKGEPELIPVKQRKIKELGFEPFFDKIVLSTEKSRKEIEEIKRIWQNIPDEDIVVIGDRALVDVKIANELGMKSIWLKKGKFAEESPNEETGEPTYIIYSLQELKKNSLTV